MINPDASHPPAALNSVLNESLTQFDEAREAILREESFRDWVIATGIWAAEAAYLKLFKSRWYDGRSGIFFSAWVDAGSFAKLRVRYNIHAFKLRQLAGFNLESRKFAAEFRLAFEPVQSEWPNVSTSFGPQTLMEGWFENPKPLAVAAIAQLARPLLSVSLILDELLDSARKEHRHG